MKEWLTPEFHEWVVKRALEVLIAHKEERSSYESRTEMDEDVLQCRISPHQSADEWERDLYYRLTKTSQWLAMDKAVSELIADNRVECTRLVTQDIEYENRKGRQVKRYFAVLNILDAIVRATSDTPAELLLPQQSPNTRWVDVLDNPLGAYEGRRRRLKVSDYKDPGALQFWKMPDDH